ncbi:MAG: alpha-L-fucosidase [Planctomycetes bacterium]|nr:alpha-L-fucosidase [Planctomycetota bacterium]
MIRKLIEVASKGGNFLLNVGPTPEGRINPVEAERLEGIGRWMQRYGTAIYETTAGPFRRLPFFGCCTQRGRTLYVHVFALPEDGQLSLAGLKNEIVRAYPASPQRQELVFLRGPQRALILPGEGTDPVASVFAVEVKGEPEVEDLVLGPDGEGVIELPALYAEIRGQHGQRASRASQEGRVYVGTWSNPDDVAVWDFYVPAEGSYAVELDARLASKHTVGQRIEVAAGEQKLLGKLGSDGVSLSGQVRLAKGMNTLSVKLPDAKRMQPPVLDLFGVTLMPVEH